jgi:dihydrofolate synthase/folylpolyglutamate synthase
VRNEPLCILDGAHNIDGCSKLCDTIDSLLQDRRIFTVMAMGADKPFAQCAPMLEKRSVCFTATDFAGVEDAVRKALETAQPDDVVLACGSLYILGNAKRVMSSMSRSRSSLIT